MLSLYVLTLLTTGSDSMLNAVFIFGVTVCPSNETEIPPAALLRRFGQLLEIVHSILSEYLLQKSKYTCVSKRPQRKGKPRFNFSPWPRPGFYVVKASLTN